LRVIKRRAKPTVKGQRWPASSANSPVKGEWRSPGSRELSAWISHMRLVEERDPKQKMGKMLSDQPKPKKGEK
jgi:hypothetical protein